jgi:hypothetical protein
MMATKSDTPASTLLEYTGVLIHPAQARSRPADQEGHIVPVLCVEIALENAVGTVLHAEQVFPFGAHDQAAAAARRLHKGDRITVQAGLADLRLLVTNTAHIHVIPT